MHLLRISGLKLLRLFAFSLFSTAVVLIFTTLKSSFTQRFHMELDASNLQSSDVSRSAVVNITRLPPYARKWYEELGVNLDRSLRRRRFSTILVVTDALNYANNSAQLSAKLVALALNDCTKNTNVSGTADDRTGFLVYVLVSGDSMTSASALEKSLYATLKSKNCCRELVVTVRYVKKLSVTDINNAALDAYLDMEGEYFRLVFLSSNVEVTSNEQNLSTWQLADALDHRMQPAGHGMVVKTLDCDIQSSAAWVFWSAAHMEIFGWLLPPEVEDVQLSLEIFLAVYEKYNLTRYITKFPSANNGEASKGNDGVKWIAGQRKNVVLASDSIKQQFSEVKETIDRYMAVRSSCWRCNEIRHRHELKVVSMSVYGGSRRYTAGVVRNAQLLPVTFPGWQLRIYCELPATSDGSGTKYGAVPHYVLRRLVQLGVELYPVNTSVVGDAYNLAPMLWRFLIADDDSVQAFIVRDADSRLTPRDAAVVNTWLDYHPEAAFHCIRDHPSHSLYSVSGGLWGGRPKFLRATLRSAKSPLTDLIAAMRRYSAGYVDDMNFLGRDIWPRVQSVAYCHDSFSCDRYAASHPFPIVRQGSEHLGQVYNEFNIGRQGDINILMRAKINTKCIPMTKKDNIT